MARAPQTPAKSFDFAALSFQELQKLKKEIDAELESRRAEEMQALRDKIAESAQSLGVSIKDLLGLQPHVKRETRHPRGKQPPKYRGPGGEEWSGRGPSPKWMKPLLAKGKKKEDFLIKP